MEVGASLRAALRSTVVGIVATMAAFGCAAADWPMKPVRVVVPFAAGGAGDILTRLVASKLQERLGQPVVVDNRPGAGSVLGTQIVAKSPADGYTVLMSASSLVLMPLLKRPIGFDPKADLIAVGNVVTLPLVLVSRGDSQLRTLDDVLRQANANPGKLNYGSNGVGTSTHLAGEMLKLLTGAQIVHVPYKGGGQALLAILSGEVQLNIDGPAASMPYFASGQLRPVVVLSAKRTAALPNVPTAAEVGVSGYDAQFWLGLLAPAGTPQDVVTRLNREVNAVLQMPDVRDRLVSLGMDPAPGLPQDFASLISGGMKHWAEVVQRTGIVLE